jgi:hypothetical protein
MDSSVITENYFREQFLHRSICTEDGADIDIFEIKKLDLDVKKVAVLFNGKSPYAGSCIEIVEASGFLKDIAGNQLAKGVTHVTGGDRLYPVTIEVLRPMVYNPVFEDIEKMESGKNHPGTTIALTSVNRAFDVKVFIYTTSGSFVRELHLKDGGLNSVSLTPESRTDYISWNLRDGRGVKVGSGVYLWKVIVNYHLGKSETFTLKSGVMR